MMSKEEIIHEINEVLDHLSDKKLQDILSMLKDIDGKQPIYFSDSATLDKILTEDRDLLEKLAQ